MQHQQQPQASEMMRAFLAGDASYDGIFYTGVKTTGIFCRPSCSARKPLPENVEFYSSSREALFAGYRPCKRCKPLETGTSIPDWVQPILEAVEKDPSARLHDSDLRGLGVDPARLRRYFLDRFKMTFHAYARARRLAGAFTQIREGTSIDDAVFESGYESHSGFREAYGRTFGVPPGASRQTGERVLTAWLETPVGPMIAGASERGLCLLEFTDRRMLERQMEIVRRRFGCMAIPGEHAHLDTIRRELEAYFRRELHEFTVPLDVRGTPFQEQVWRLLLTIPYGQTWSYEQLAVAAGNPAAVRAVARANGMNRMAIVIPCHRVVNKNGELGGYGGGIWRKTTLLDLERGTATPSQNPLPFAAQA
ncbi:MAG TPA: methylated-DNA--[protein]-cysteine S-methyltransferase [Bryobacteraceae bacterium]|nr:methylated-DNA--[protein]-cysteine S-methyltransferase [Bryobacteraceae bacterium]